MAEKGGILSFILKIAIQILNFILSRICKNKKESEKSDNIKYVDDTNENIETKDKINDLIRDKINRMTK